MQSFTDGNLQQNAIKKLNARQLCNCGSASQLLRSSSSYTVQITAYQNETSDGNDSGSLVSIRDGKWLRKNLGF